MNDFNLNIEKETVKAHFVGHWQGYYSTFLDLKNGNGAEYKALCPFHPDSDPSFSINSDTGQFHCFGCQASGDAFQFYGKLKGIESFDGQVRGIAAEFGISSNGKKSGPGRIVKTCDYVNAEGALLYQAVRMEPKSFRQRRPDGKGGWIWNMQNVDKVLYRLPEVLQAGLVVVVEGEKDADNLFNLGLTTTTNVGGAGKWQHEYSVPLKGKDVAILPDNDEPGRNHAEKVAGMLHGIAKLVKVIELPGIPEKGDVSDWINAGGTKEALLNMIEDAPLWEPGTIEEAPGLSDCVIDFNALLQMDIKERTRIFPWLPEGGLVMIYGPRGIGKTYLVNTLATSCCSGSPFFKWGKPLKVVGVMVIDGEMSLADLRERLTALLIAKPTMPLKVVSSEVVFAKTDRDINLVAENQKSDVLSILDNDKEIRLVIIDNISCLFSGLRESSKDDWGEQVAPWLLALRRRGVAVVLIHHAGKGGDQRGTSGREDLLDTVIRLDRVNGVPNDGARFVVRFTKCRGVFGGDVEPFEASLNLDDPELWTWRPLEESTYDRMINLARDGVETVSDMAEELGVSKGMVSKLKKQGIEKGELMPGKFIRLKDADD